MLHNKCTDINILCKQQLMAAPVQLIAPYFPIIFSDQGMWFIINIRQSSVCKIRDNESVHRQRIPGMKGRWEEVGRGVYIKCISSVKREITENGIAKGLLLFCTHFFTV